MVIVGLAIQERTTSDPKVLEPAFLLALNISLKLKHTSLDTEAWGRKRAKLKTWVCMLQHRTPTQITGGKWNVKNFEEG
eukprot:1161745-Pelagomonas_calceolata.AAC.3